MDRADTMQEIFQNMGIMIRFLSTRKHEDCSKNTPTYAQMKVLFSVAHNNRLTIKDIAGLFGMSSSAATQLVNGLVQEGLLARKNNKTDRRKTQLIVTTKGKKNMAAIKKKHYESVSELLETLTAEELDQLKNIQNKIAEHIKTLWTKK